MRRRAVKSELTDLSLRILEFDTLREKGRHVIYKNKMIMKVNEFVNNNNLKEEFEKLDRMVFLETAHLANFFQLDDNEHYKIMLENLNGFLPFIVDKIINDEYRYVHKLLISKVVDFNKDNFIDSVSNWWEENKFKYGK